MAAGSSPLQSSNVVKLDYVSSQAIENTPVRKGASKNVPDFLSRFGVTVGEWQYALKSGFQVLMRPGWDLRVRTWACLQLHTTGYKQELAVTQVRGLGGDKLVVPFTSALLCKEIQEAAIEAFRESGEVLGSLLGPEDTEKLTLDLGCEPLPADLETTARRKARPSGPNMRKLLADMEEHDGIITRVRAKGMPQKLLGLSFGEALQQGLITPLRDLPQKERKLLIGRSLIYMHSKPRPATLTALLRRTDDGQAAIKSHQQEIAAMLSAPQQLVFRFLCDEEWPDADLAKELSLRDEVQSLVSTIERQKDAVKHAEAALRALVGSVVKERKAAVPSAQQALFPAAVDGETADRRRQSLSAANPHGKGDNHVRTSTSLAAAAAPMNPADQGRQAGTPAPERDRASRPAPPISPADIAQLVEVMRRVGAGEDSAARTIITRCREHEPRATIAQICTAVESKFDTIREMLIRRKMGNITAWLITYVPLLFERASFEQWQRQAEDPRSPVASYSAPTADELADIERELAHQRAAVAS